MITKRLCEYIREAKSQRMRNYIADKRRLVVEPLMAFQVRVIGRQVLHRAFDDGIISHDMWLRFSGDKETRTKIGSAFLQMPITRQ